MSDAVCRTCIYYIFDTRRCGNWVKRQEANPLRPYAPIAAEPDDTCERHHPTALALMCQYLAMVGNPGETNRDTIIRLIEQEKAMSSLLNKEQQAALKHCAQNGHSWRKIGLVNHICECCGYSRCMVDPSAGGWRFNEAQNAIIFVYGTVTADLPSDEKLARLERVCKRAIDASEGMRSFIEETDE